MPAPADPSPTIARSTRLLVCLVIVTASGLGFARTLWAPTISDPVPPARIDLNTAGVHELDLLPRIGPALAARIVEDRAAHGPFESIESLRRVRGIGPKTVEGLRSAAEVSHAAAGGNTDE